MSIPIWIERFGPETVINVDLDSAKVNGMTASIALTPLQAIEFGRLAQDNQAGVLMWLASQIGPKR